MPYGPLLRFPTAYRHNKEIGFPKIRIIFFVGAHACRPSRLGSSRDGSELVCSLTYYRLLAQSYREAPSKRNGDWLGEPTDQIQDRKM